MKNTVVFCILIVCMVLAWSLEGFVPSLGILGGARTDIVTVLFCYGALLLPFPGAMLLGLLTGLLIDLGTMQILSSHVEIALGWSSFLYVLFASVLQGVRPLFLRERWEVHAFASAGCVIVFLAAQFLMITFRRGGLEMPMPALGRILASGLLAFLISPIIYFFGKLAGAMPRRGRLR